MSKLFMDNGYISLIKHGEQLCGDHVVIRTGGDPGDFTMVLADGLGSGVKASILSTLTATIIATMVDSDMPIEECVATIAHTLPVCSVRGMAYSTFSVIRVVGGKEVRIIQYDNPEVIVLRGGKSFDYPREVTTISDKLILKSRFELKLGDVFIAMSDGAIHAGVGTALNFGWERPNIVEYAQTHYKPDMSARGVAALISDACRDLYLGEPGDDTTIAALKVRLREPINLMIGPPVDPGDDERVMGAFFAEEGKKIVCGGTTATLAARHLGVKVQTSIDYLDPHIPPTARIAGVDLCTEGVLTMSHVVDIARRYTSPSQPYNEWMDQRDGASQIARMLFEEATDVNLFVGRAINPAHQNPNMPISLSIKMGLIEDLASLLAQMGKHVKVVYN